MSGGTGSIPRSTKRALRWLVSRNHLIRHICCVAGLAVLATGAPAIVIRHDVDDRKYRADETKMPAIFAIYRNKSGRKDCVATLIDEKWAVTAAHCTKDRPFLDAMAVPGGTFEVEIAGRKARIDKVIRHPASERARNGAFEEWVDLALIRFSQPIKRVRVVKLHSGRSERGTEVLLPGWGTSGNGDVGLKEPDGLFRIAENRVDRVSHGWIMWKFEDPRTDPMTLRLEGVSGPGDSGGPALVKRSNGYEILGVSSSQRTFGKPEGTYGVMEGYVRVSTFAPWIRAETANIVQ